MGIEDIYNLQTIKEKEKNMSEEKIEDELGEEGEDENNKDKKIWDKIKIAETNIKEAIEMKDSFKNVDDDVCPDKSNPMKGTEKEMMGEPSAEYVMMVKKSKTK
ncbi:MAG: hypothetical protein ACYDEI_00065 [Erysipelotrichaceae bacterium]